MSSIPLAALRESCVHLGHGLWLVSGQAALSCTGFAACTGESGHDTDDSARKKFDKSLDSKHKRETLSGA